MVWNVTVPRLFLAVGNERSVELWNQQNLHNNAGMLNYKPTVKALLCFISIYLFFVFFKHALSPFVRL